MIRRRCFVADGDGKKMVPFILGPAGCQLVPMTIAVITQLMGDIILMKLKQQRVAPTMIAIKHLWPDLWLTPKPALLNYLVGTSNIVGTAVMP